MSWSSEWHELLLVEPVVGLVPEFNNVLVKHGKQPLVVDFVVGGRFDKSFLQLL